MKAGNLAILGSTGSIGRQTLDIVRQNRDRLKVVALSANQNLDLISEQVDEFAPELVVFGSEEIYLRAKERLASKTKLAFGQSGLDQAVSTASVHTVVAAISGFAGLASVLTAIDQGKHIALANKEALIAGGHIVNQKLAQSKSVLIPVDSEHSSIYQCLMASVRGDLLSKIVLTASGGPFLNTDPSEFSHITTEQALKHPRWNMGAKISIDSATLMNKGLEVIEAAYLFKLDAKKIDVLIHPQSLVHGFVYFDDGSVLAAMFEADMKAPISFALSKLTAESPGLGVRNLESGVSQLDLVKHKTLEFFEVDHRKFPALNLAYRALETSPAHVICLNAANEIAVASFLSGSITFPEITSVVEDSLTAYNDTRNTSSVEEIVEIDAYSRAIASKFCSARKSK